VQGDVADLRAYLRDRLPHAMVPADINVLDGLQLLPNGKLDLGALPESRLAHSAEATYLAPRNVMEQRLVDIWAAALNCERVGVRDDFFALRGHSLLATRVMARIRDELQVDLPLQCLFESPTVEGLARQIDALGWAMRNDFPDSTDDREVTRI
jgi:hypothetical protein